MGEQDQMRRYRPISGQRGYNPEKQVADSELELIKDAVTTMAPDSDAQKELLDIVDKQVFLCVGDLTLTSLGKFFL